jgi:predicted ATP-grasp superfamily ATP-dependent carboligase
MRARRPLRRNPILRRLSLEAPPLPPIVVAVLLTDAQERSAPAACESLSRAGYRVGAASSETPAPGRWSRFCDERFDVPDPRVDRRAFAQAVGQVARAGSFGTLVPGSDAALIAISSHRDLFPAGLELGLPPREVVDACVSKLSLTEVAANVGLAVPDTIACADWDEALAAAARLRYPVLLKPQRSVSPQGEQLRQRSSFLAADEAALAERLPGFGFPCLLQRQAPGSIYSIGGVMAAGSLLCYATSVYTRTWPPNAGPVCFSETVSAPASILDRVERLVAATGWEGIFELELIRTQDGGFTAIDFNPRLYGSLALAVGAGAPLPAIWCDWLLRGQATRCAARAGVCYRLSDADLRHVLALLLRGRPAAAGAVLRPRRRTVHPYLRRRDPAPGLARLAQMIRHRLPRRTARTPSELPTPSQGEEHG